MKRFRYALDPFCLAALTLYALQRWAFEFTWLHGWFADVLFIPAAAPLFLWVERQLGLRRHDQNPTLRELIFLFATWSVAAEILASSLFAHCTADPLDVLAYGAGTFVSAAWWGWLSAPREATKATKNR